MCFNLVICGQQFLFFPAYWISTRVSSGATLSPFLTWTLITTPLKGAWISFSIFMASMTSTPSPASTLSPTLTLTSTMVPGMAVAMQP